MASGFGLDCAKCFAVHEECVLRFTRGKGEFAQRHAMCGREVDFILRLDSPARRGELRVDTDSGFLFRRHDPRAIVSKRARTGNLPCLPRVWSG